jgi:ubiquinone/menaquinone biosynthesis C-methylase UbiE
MKNKNPEKRLEKFWGKVDKKHVQIIGKFLHGKNVLDMGCGYGTTTAYVTSQGYNCIGIDYDQSAIDSALKRFPGCKYQFANAEALPFENDYFDVIIMRDALHHFKGEADFEKVKTELLRVTKKDATVIFFDPNVNFMLRTMRKISFHKDEECDYEDAVKIMGQLDFKITHASFNTLYSLPLSGGYVGVNFVPDLGVLHSFILGSERFFEKIVNGLGLGRYLCWRYVIVGQRKT